MIEKVENLTIPDIVELFYLYQHEPDNLETFYFNLIGAIKTADVRNTKRLRIVFPNFCYVHKMWLAAGEFGDALYKKYQIGQFKKQEIIDITGH